MLSEFDGERFGPAHEVTRGSDFFANWADTPGVGITDNGRWLIELEPQLVLLQQALDFEPQLLLLQPAQLIKQEFILGIGGIRMLDAIGLSPSVYHMNEGHSAFLALERIRMLMERQGVEFEVARQAAGSGHVFTTHTPVDGITCQGPLAGSTPTEGIVQIPGQALSIQAPSAMHRYMPKWKGNEETHTRLLL